MDKQILVIDDEPMLCRALGSFLRDKRLRVETAHSAREAMEQLSRTPTDVVVLDLRLPDASGLEVLSQVKAKFPQVRVVVVSAFADSTTAQQALALGASEYLPKPFDFDRCFYAALGVEMADPSTLEIPRDVLEAIPARTARDLRVLPVRRQGDALHVAMADPMNEDRLAQLRQQVPGTIVPIAAGAESLQAAIRRWYGSEMAADPAANSPTPVRSVEPIAEDPLLDPLLRGLLAAALQRRATVVQLGLGPDGVWLRERVDGILHEVSAPKAVTESYDWLVTRVKQLARLDVGQRQIPQQGRCRLTVDERPLEIAVSVAPAARGEHVVVRLFDPDQRIRLDELGWSAEQRERLEPLLGRSSGLVLVTGPGDAGLSTTLQAMLERLGDARKHVVTIEETIQREWPGVTQLQTGAGLAPAQAVRSAVAQDADVILVDDVADGDTAHEAIRASLAGRLVVAGLHTMDAAHAVTRLLDLRIEPFFLCSTLSGIIAQRLVRRLCASCRAPSPVTPEGLAALGLEPPKGLGELRLWHAKGCETCRHTGYFGRTGLFEVLVVDHQIRALIIKRTSGAQIRQSAISRGMVSLSRGGWERVQRGDTSLEELLRVLAPDVR